MRLSYPNKREPCSAIPTTKSFSAPPQPGDLAQALVGKLPLAQPPSRYLPDLRKRHHVASLSIDEDSAVTSGKLPTLHRDPFDRMLVAQAIVHGLTILTPDPLVHQYAVPVDW